MARNFVSLLEASADRWPDTPALVWPDGALTFAGLHRRAQALAAALATKGVKPGDRIAVAIPNRWQFAVAVLAGWKLGATIAPLDPLLKSDERAEILADLAPAMLVDEATVTPVGGLPLAHAYGLNGALLAPLLAGASVALVERFTPEAALEAIRRHRVTVFPGVATMFRRVLDGPSLTRADLSSLRLAVSGAAPCPWDLAQEWRERTGIRILRGYGMSELFRPISYLAADMTESPAAIGHAVPGVEVRVVDDSGRPLPNGEVGELWIKSPAAMQGYVNSPEESREVLTEDGWFRTGDLALVSDDGLVEIVGRKRERILRGGYSVFPAEVEALLLTHPAVAEAAVVGLPHPELGEEVAAFVALRPSAGATADELIAYCRERLAGFKYPRQVTVLPALPRSAAGKILKSSLRRPR
ncbi:MAG: AMP-binding protein [Candidatus Rokubacteria bacterium]|nr:AMP-binding protein [Candidatus Rokubacteria bacterium]